jgi:hypothetical protein
MRGPFHGTSTSASFSNSRKRRPILLSPQRCAGARAHIVRIAVENEFNELRALVLADVTGKAWDVGAPLHECRWSMAE